MDTFYLINKKNGLKIRHLLASHKGLEWTRFEETTWIFLMEWPSWWILAICRICTSENESISYILSQCPPYHMIRDRTLQEFSKIFLFTQNSLNFENIRADWNILLQFILDPTSFYLETRVHVSDPVVPEIIAWLYTQKDLEDYIS